MFSIKLTRLLQAGSKSPQVWNLLLEALSPFILRDLSLLRNQVPGGQGSPRPPPSKALSEMFWLTRTAGQPVPVGKSALLLEESCSQEGLWSCYYGTQQTCLSFNRHWQTPTRDAVADLARQKQNGPLTPASLYHWEGHLNLKEDSSEVTGTWDFIFPKASTSCVSKPSIIKQQQLKQDHPGIQPKGGLQSGLYGPFIEGSFKGPLQSPV